MKKIILLAVLISVSTSTFLAAQTNQTQKEQFEGIYNTTKAIVQSQKFQFVANVVFVGRKRESFKNATNQITFNKASIFGELNTFSSEETRFTFKERKNQITTSFDDDKQVVSVAVKTKSGNILIDVKPNGNAFLTLTGYGNDEVTYRGTLLKL